MEEGNLWHFGQGKNTSEVWKSKRVWDLSKGVTGMQRYSRGSQRPVQQELCVLSQEIRSFSKGYGVPQGALSTGVAWVHCGKYTRGSGWGRNWWRKPRRGRPITSSPERLGGEVTAASRWGCKWGTHSRDGADSERGSLGNDRTGEAKVERGGPR